MKNKCTLICDFNWLTISRFSVINKGFDKTLPEHALDEAKEELGTLSFNHVLLHKKDTKMYQVIF